MMKQRKNHLKDTYNFDHCASGSQYVGAERGGIINESLDIVESGKKMMEWPDTDDEAT